mgnify:FL=1
MKHFKIIFVVVIFNLTISACGTVKDAFDPQRKNSSDEFLVEKKSPLSMPPDFEKLPQPKNKKDNNIPKDDFNLESIINTSQNESESNNNESSKDSSNLEESIIDIIKNN